LFELLGSADKRAIAGHIPFTVQPPFQLARYSDLNTIYTLEHIPTHTNNKPTDFTFPLPYPLLISNK